MLLDLDGDLTEDDGEPANTTGTAASGRPGAFSLAVPKALLAHARATLNVDGAALAAPPLLTLLPAPPPADAPAADAPGAGAPGAACVDTGTGAPARVPLFARLPSSDAEAAAAAPPRRLAISSISSVLASFPSDVPPSSAASLVQARASLVQAELG